jgi:hypothetical protein
VACETNHASGCKEVPVPVEASLRPHARLPAENGTPRERASRFILDLAPNPVEQRNRQQFVISAGHIDGGWEITSALA